MSHIIWILRRVEGSERSKGGTDKYAKTILRVPESEKRNLLHYSLLHLHTDFCLLFHKQCKSSLWFCNSARWLPTSINTGYHTHSHYIFTHSYAVFISNRIKNNVRAGRESFECTRR